MSYISREIVSAMLTGDVTLGESGPLLPNDLLEDGDASHQIVATHYERRQQTKCVLPGGEYEDALIPTPPHDLIGRLHNIEPPDETGAANRSHFSGPVGHCGELPS